MSKPSRPSDTSPPLQEPARPVEPSEHLALELSILESEDALRRLPPEPGEGQVQPPKEPEERPPD